MRRLGLSFGFIMLGAPGIDVGFHHSWWAVFATIPLAWALTWLILPPAGSRP